MYDDFYEPSEFDIMVDEFKQELRNSVKKEILEEIETLKDKLAELTDIKQNWDTKVRELNEEKRKAQMAAHTAEQNAKKMTLRQLLEPLKHDAWGIKQNWEYVRDKCDKCDAQGYIHYKSPQGRDMKEACDCRKRICHYLPVEAEVYKIEGRSHGFGANITYVFEHTNLDYDWQDKFKTERRVYNGEPFEDVDQYCYGMIFYDKNKAQEFCDWKNEKVKERWIW